MAAPPLEDEALKEMLALVCPVEVAVPITGALGTRTGEVVIKLEAADGADTPALLVAVTVKV